MNSFNPYSSGYSSVSTSGSIEECLAYVSILILLDIHLLAYSLNFLTHQLPVSILILLDIHLLAFIGHVPVRIDKGFNPYSSGYSSVRIGTLFDSLGKT